ncbi:hypothetical protein [Pseudonocardia humida]|uniref:Uncharacterized protein n=1 Tax=Pseudonocardia humida TaxID=2800819 RepID=A0ABT1A340_9PSEU|nr:hypothetical protein [Pseudonocardia humida]MCO1657269.1 hypothetical protein [Pseudonocardia humida]
MSHRTLLHAIAKRATAKIVAVEDRIFADDDLAALVRGWRITRPHPFTRTYRDARWDQVGLEPIPPNSRRS